MSRGRDVAVSVATRALGIKFFLWVAVAVVLAFIVMMLVVVPNVVTAQQSAADDAGPCATGANGAPPQAPAEIREEQIANAKAIDQAAQQVGLSGEASRLAIIAAFGESTLINLDYGDQVNGVRNPDGSLATSYGLFQQQTSQGWGTKEQVMDPTYAATSFFTGPKHDNKGGLVAVAGWEDMEPTLAIHAVQRNADPNHYATFYSAADEIIAAAEINTDRAGTVESPEASGGSPVQGCGVGTVSPGVAENDYPFSESQVPGPGVYEVDPWSYYLGECTSFVAWRINRDAGSTEAPYKYSGAAGNFQNGNANTWKAAWESRGWKVSNTPVPGAVAWWDAFGEPGVGYAGHVAYVHSVTADGRVILEEYNNAGLAPPGHKYSMREPQDADSVNAYLLPPEN